jgi:hypothetical protein
MKINLTAVLRKDKVNSANQHPLVIRVSYGGKKSRVGLGYSLELTKWNDADETPNKRCEDKLKREIVKKIETEKVRIEEAFRGYYQREGEYPSHPQLLALLKESKGRKNNSSTFNQRLIREYKDFIRERKVSIATYKAYSSTLVKLEEFLQDYKLGSYKDINDKFHNTFTTKLEKEKLRGGTIGKYTKNIKAFLNHLAKQDKINPAQYKDFRINKKYQIKPSLDLGDITLMKYAIGLEKHSQLDKLKIPKLTPEEKNILIVYLWLCGTGQSFIDYKTITGKAIKQDGNITETLSITYTRTKLDNTKKAVIVLTEDLLDILIFYYNQFDYSNKLFNQVRNKVNDKNEDKLSVSVGMILLLSKKFSELQKQVGHYPFLLPQFSNQYFNRAIKQVAEKIGMKGEVDNSVNWEGKMQTREGDRKCDLISSHLCRKYFIESKIAEGFGYEDIMARTGISSLNTLFRYNTISKEILIRNAINTPTPKANKNLIDSLAFNITMNKGNKKNSTPSRHSQIPKKPKNGFTLQVGKKKK